MELKISNARKALVFFLALAMVTTCMFASGQKEDWRVYAADTANAQYSLAGAEYWVYTNAGCTTRAQDADGNNAVLTTKADGTTNELELEAGTYYVKEKSASSGYILDTTVYTVNVEAGETSWVNGNPGVKEVPQSAPLSVQKVDWDTGDPVKMAGIRFEVKYSDGGSVNRTWTIETDSNGLAKLDNNHLVDGDNLYKNSQNQYVVPLGTVTVKEVSSPVGYARNDEVYTINIGWDEANATNETTTHISGSGSKSGQIETNPIKVKFRDKKQSAPISIQKVDKETGKASPIGGAKFANTTFELTCTSGEDNGKKWIMKSGESGLVSLENVEAGSSPVYKNSAGKAALLVGKYVLKETAAPEGYLLNNGTYTITVAGDTSGSETTSAITGSDSASGAKLESVNPMKVTFPNQVMRGDLSFHKERTENHSRLKNIPFLIENTKTHEKHVVVTGVNGIYKSSYTGKSGEYKHTTNTNANDYVIVDGNVVVNSEGLIDESNLDYTAGTWFGLDSAGNMAVADDDLRALPYGVYRITELRVTANKNLNTEEVDFEIEIAEDDVDYPIGGIENEPLPPEIRTNATDVQTNSHIGSVGEEVVIKDTVAYINLTPGKEYTMKGYLVNKETEEPVVDKNGKRISASKKFTPESSDGSVEIEFVIDSSLVAGKSVVAFEECSYRGNNVAVHADIEDENQTIYFPGVATQADRAVTAESHKVTDTVALTNLVTDKEYTVKGTLMDKATTQPMKDKSGNAITAEKTFTATTKDMEIVLEFDVTNTDIIGKTGVVFERLYYNNVEVGSHEDIEDPKQTVEFPKLETEMYKIRNEEAPDKAGNKFGFFYGDKVTYTVYIQNKGNVDTITDVTDEFVEPEKFSKPIVESVKNATQNSISEDKNRVNITIKAGETAEVVYSAIVQHNIPEYLADAAKDSDSTKDGKDCNRTVKDNTPDDNDGYVNIAKLEKCKYIDPKDPENPKEDPEKPPQDDANTPVQKPQIATNAVGKDTADHIALKGDEVVIIDEVTYAGLTPGLDYTLKAELKNKQTEETMATSEKTFTPEKSRGMVEVEFIFASDGNETAVAFEELYDVEGELIAEHKDINDESQTVYIPEIGTKANLGKKDVVDKIEYENLLVGKDYVFKGYLVNSKGEKLKGSDGQFKLTAKKAKGSVKVTLPIKFELSRLSGQKLVAFEECYIVNDEGVETLVAIHKDLDDESQTVTIGNPEIGTYLADGAGKKEISPNSKTELIDTVKYKGLVPGHKYAVVGELIVKDTGNPLVESGKKVRAIGFFIPKESSGTVKVAFTVNTTGLAGKELVAFETAYSVEGLSDNPTIEEVEDNGEIVAVHKDLKDKAQTVKIKGPNSPSTGDKTFVLGFIALFAIAATGIFAMIRRRRKLQ